MFEEKLHKIDELQKEIKTIRPLNQNETDQLREYYRIGLVYSSNAIEGNSLTESETKVIIEDGITIGGKTIREHLEVLGHSEAFSFIQSIANKKLFAKKDLLEIHRLFYGKINEKQAGIYRNDRVIVTESSYSFSEPSDIDILMDIFLNNISENYKKMHPVLFSAKVHKDFVFIHPFVDGNGRVARLLMNLILIQNQYLITIIPPVSRHRYIENLEKAHSDDTDFCNFILQCHIEAQKEYIRLLSPTHMN
jgi:Fic family protein